MVMRKSPRQHNNPNLEYVFNDEGEEVAVIRDGARMRVSLMDAMASRGQQADAAERQLLSDAEHRVADYQEMQRRDYYNKPGFRNRVLSDQQTIDNQTVRDFEYARYEQELVNSYKLLDASANAESEKSLGGPNTQTRGRAFSGQRGSKPGDACSIDGEAGTLQYNSDGELVCRVQSNSNDNPEQALSDAYRDHENYLNHAWRLK